MLDSRPTVAWPPTTVAWPFGEFLQKVSKLLETSKNVVWQSADGGVTSDHCRVTVQRLFSNFFLIARNVQKTLFDSRPTVAWPQPLSRDRSATVFKIFPNCFKRPKNVVWQSVDGRVTSDHCRVTVQRLFSNIFLIARNVQKTLFDSRPMVAWPPTTLARHHILLRRCISRSYFFIIIIIINSFRQKLGHVSPPTGMVRSWKFRHHIKARDRTKRIFDFGGKIPTRSFPMRGTNSPL